MLLRIPDLGASRRIQAMFFIIGGIRIGYSGISSTRVFPGVLVRATIQASKAPNPVPNAAAPPAYTIELPNIGRISRSPKTLTYFNKVTPTEKPNFPVVRL